MHLYKSNHSVSTKSFSIPKVKQCRTLGNCLRTADSVSIMGVISTLGMQGDDQKMVEYKTTECCFRSHLTYTRQRKVTINGKEILFLKLRPCNFEQEL